MNLKFYSNQQKRLIDGNDWISSKALIQHPGPLPSIITPSDCPTTFNKDIHGSTIRISTYPKDALSTLDPDVFVHFCPAGPDGRSQFICLLPICGALGLLISFELDGNEAIIGTQDMHFHTFIFQQTKKEIYN